MTVKKQEKVMLEKIALSPRSYAVLCLGFGNGVVEEALRKMNKEYFDDSVKNSDIKEFYAMKSLCENISREK